jgi:hypothetical protein
MKNLLVLSIVLFSALVAGCNRGNKEYATNEMKSYMYDLGYTPVGVTCQDVDTNHDGYVSCTGSYKNSKGDVVILAAQCAISMAGNEGCKQNNFIPSNNNN